MAKKNNQQISEEIKKPVITEYIEDSSITDFMTVVDNNDNDYPTFEEIDKVTDLSIITGESKIIDDKPIYFEYDRSFSAKLILLSDEKKSYYKKVRNTFNAYALILKTTWQNEEFYAGDDLVAKFGVRGKSLYLYLVKNKEHHTFVRILIGSNRSVKIAKELIKSVMEKLEQERKIIRPLKFSIELESQEKLVEKGYIKLIKTKDIVVFKEELSIHEEDLTVVEEVEEEEFEEVVEAEPEEVVDTEPEEVEEEEPEEVEEEEPEKVVDTEPEEVEEEESEDVVDDELEEDKDVSKILNQVAGTKRGIRLRRKPNRGIFRR